MAKKCLEEFNPWPPFVDIFSSTILVLLLFMLILIVNLGYYAQFKFKVSYTGTIATDQLVLNEEATVNKVKEIKKTHKSQKEQTTQEPIKKTSIINTEMVEEKDMEKAGQDMTNVDDTQTTAQQTIEEDQYMVVTFANEEILLDDIIIKKIKAFLVTAKEKYTDHNVIVSSVSPTNQVSATVAKQIALARSLNIRNLIRKQKYKKSDVRIRRISPELEQKVPPSETGFVVISIQVNN